MTYLITGATGFIGRHLLSELVLRDADIRVLVRPGSLSKLDGILRGLPRADRVRPVRGDITQPGLGIDPHESAALSGAEIFHLAAVYDMDASEEMNRSANVDGTRNVVEWANVTRAARLHHVSSIAVAGGRWKGEFTEEMFDEGQVLDHPYYQTKFESERLVRQEAKVPWRVYRPGVVIGSSVTGEADRIDGPYFAFKLIQRLRGSLPEWWPMIGPEGGELNLVPVDFVARALDHIAHQPGLDGRTFHIVDPHPLSLGDTINEFCRAAHAPEFTLRIDRRATALIPSGFRETLERWPAFQTIRAQVLQGIHIPEAVLAYTRNRARFTCGETLRALDAAGIKCPPLHSYAWRIWDYWERHLDPHIPNERNLRRLLQDKVVLVTGASSGIGRAVAMRLSSYGAVMVLVSRQEDKLQEVRADIEAAGGRAHVRPTDLTDLDAIDAMARDVLAEHGKVDVLINNAGRSIRRAVEHEYERFHDFTRTMQLNYFGSLRLILAVLPGMRERGEGHIINISSIGVQAFPPRFSAYVASKAALAGFSRCMAAEVAHDGVAVTNIHMPLINTPMIAPTTMYQFIPVGETNEAADLVVEALLKRPPEMGTRLGKLGEAVDVLAPGFLQLVMTGAYHLFPESGRLRDGKEGEEPSTEAIALSYLLRGIHF